MNCQFRFRVLTRVFSNSSFPEHGILNDSSFAAVRFLDGSRYVFFQDVSGVLRQSAFSPQDQRWITGDESILPDDSPTPRDHTSLSACITSNTSLWYYAEVPISLVYVSENLSLAGAFYTTGI